MLVQRLMSSLQWISLTHPSSPPAFLLKEQSKDALSNFPGQRVIKTDTWQTGNNVKIRFEKALQPSGANRSQKFIFFQIKSDQTLSSICRGSDKWSLGWVLLSLLPVKSSRFLDARRMEERRGPEMHRGLRISANFSVLWHHWTQFSAISGCWCLISLKVARARDPLSLTTSPATKACTTALSFHPCLGILRGSQISPPTEPPSNPMPSLSQGPQPHPYHQSYFHLIQSLRILLEKKKNFCHLKRS